VPYNNTDTIKLVNWTNADSRRGENVPLGLGRARNYIVKSPHLCPLLLFLEETSRENWLGNCTVGSYKKNVIHKSVGLLY
jgi:hypothetical protein